ncbi:MAG: tRNA (adenine-N1)-methyltransferase [Thermoplasmata archaeon]|nr:tRNA (adenine-N1)-methyltransferase [Thermoplasmata archaeon]
MIAEGTKVLLIDSQDKRVIVTASRKIIEVGALGVIDGSKICDSSFGEKLGIGGRDFLIVRPSVRDILRIIERRAQIIVPKDSFLIPMYLDLGAGSKVLEAGVGSGALTIVLLKAVAPSGKVVSYDLREDHAVIAKKNVMLTDNNSIWKLRIGDICTADLEDDFDAVVLDMPNPWDALVNVTGALTIGGQICCYVPNTNQLHQTVAKMEDLGLSDIHAFETLQREMIVHEGGVRPSFDMLGHTGYMVFSRKIRVVRPE